jgi:hypothetical protein
MGAKRLVYGSWYSRYAMGTMLFYLHHMNVSEEELAMICAGNLEHILAAANAFTTPTLSAAGEVHDQRRQNH